MLQRNIICLAVFCVALGCGAASAEPVGSLRFCRKTDMVEPAQTEINRETVSLPPMAAFDDFGVEGENFAKTHRWALTIITLKPIELKPGQNCSTVPAMISPLSKVRSVKPSDHRHLEFGAFVKRDGREDENAVVPDDYIKIFDLDVSVGTTFR